VAWGLNILRLCREFRCLPSALLAEDASLLRMLDMEAMINEVRGGADDGQ